MLPYCGVPPVPGELVSRWNLDPVLLVALAAVMAVHLRHVNSRLRAVAGIGWAIAALAFISPICALSVALFSARIGQHMILMLIAAPLIGVALPKGSWKHSIWWSVLAVTAALWVWHMPVPYEATFHSTAVYWAMHVTLFGSAIWLWRDLLNHEPESTPVVLAAGTAASTQMALLGAVLTLSSHAMFQWHFTTTQAWGFTPLQDQQLGGALMWVPGGVIFLLAAVRSMLLLRNLLERPALR